MGGDLFLLDALTAGAAAAAATGLTSSCQLAAVRQPAADRFLLGQRQVIHPDVQIVFLGKSADQAAIIAVDLPQMMNDRLLSLQQDFDVEDFERQLQFSDQALGVIKNTLPEPFHLLSLPRVTFCQRSQQFS